MPTFIKPGLWVKTRKQLEGYLNLDLLIETIIRSFNIGSPGKLAKFNESNQLTFSSLISDNDETVSIGGPPTLSRFNITAPEGATKDTIVFEVTNASQTVRSVRVNGRGEVFLGFNAGRLSQGINNTIFGRNAMFSNVLGDGNTTFGHQSLVYAEAVETVSIGAFAGERSVSLANLTSCAKSVYIGYDVKPLNNNSTNEIIIGHNAVGAGDNTVVIGNNLIEKTILRGTINLASLPTSPTGLSAGDVYNDNSYLRIV